MCRSSPRLAATKRLLQLSAAIALFAYLGTAPANATTEYVLPSLFDVAGVAADDVLNIRAAPNARARIVGELSPRAQNIEVVGYDESGKWARVNVEGQSGWVAFRFLEYRIDVWLPEALPASLRCSGNEPFWSFETSGDTIEFSTPEVRTSVMQINAVLDSGRFRDPRRWVTASSRGQALTATIVPVACSDGMSDRAYGLDVTVMLEKRDSQQMLTGCCSIAP